MNISPVNVINESQISFYLDGKVFVADSNENTITESESITTEMQTLAWALENFDFRNNNVTWYKGVHTITYNIQEAKYFLSNTEIVAENLTNYLMSAGVVRYEEKQISDIFELATSNLDKYVDLDFVKKINEKGNLINIMKMGDNIYISRLNEANKIYNFFQASTANAAVEYVNEKAGVDVTSFLTELVEGELETRAHTLTKIDELEEITHFLKDQRGLLADADRSIEEINAADALIEGEITRVTKELAELKATL